LEEDNPRGTPGLPQHTDHTQDISAPIPHQRNLECKSNLCTATPFGDLVSAKGRYWAGNDGEDNVQQMACVVPLTVTPGLELLIKCLVNLILCTDDALTATSSNVATTWSRM